MRELDRKINEALKEANHLAVCENGKAALIAEKDTIILAAALEKSLSVIQKAVDTLDNQIVIQKREISDLRTELWKYIGIGIGASAGVSFAISIAIYLLRIVGV